MGIGEKLQQKYRQARARLTPSSSSSIAEYSTTSTPALVPPRDQGLSRLSRPVSAREPAVSTLLGSPLVNNSLPQPQTLAPTPSRVSSAGNEPSDITSTTFGIPSVHVVPVPQVAVSTDTPEDIPKPAITTPANSHDPEQPLADSLQSGPRVPAEEDGSTPAIPSTPNLLPVVPISPHVAATPESIQVPSTSPPVVLSTPGTNTPKSQNNVISTTPAKPGKCSLWEKAFDKSSEDDKKAFPFTNTDKRDYIGEILEATKKSRDICQEKRLKFTVWGKDIIVRDVADKILTWMEKFKSIGDCAAQYDPAHAALPWAGVRFLLQVAVNNKEMMEAVLIGVERITRPLVRCALYEMLYLESGLGLSVSQNLEDTLVGFYCVVLRFLVLAKRYLDKPSLGRMFHGLLEVEGKSHLDLIDNWESQVLIEVTAAEAELRRHDHNAPEGRILTTIEDRNEKLKAILQEIEKPIARIDLSVGLMHNELREHIQAERRNKILQWISKMEYEKHHRNARENLLHNTGKWLLDKKEFREWRSSSASEILWLHGIPGAGKTKLVCAVIDFLESTAQSHEPVVYVYCNRNESERRDPTVLMQAIVKQLSVVLLPGLPNPVIAEYERREERGLAAGPLGFQESCNLVHLLLDIYPHTTVIIDALDECYPDKRWELLNALKTIIHSSNSLVKIFISSRDDIDIKLELEGVPNLYIEAWNNSGDIERFVRREVVESINKRILLRGNVSDELKELIISTVVHKACGMFQWAALQITHISKMKFEDDIKNRLGKLPKTLEEAYSQIWDDILSETPHAQEVTRRALMWVMCAQAPLNQELWANASYWPGAVPKGGVLTLFELCRNLVRWDKQRRRVVFAHLSVSEYLENSKFSAMDAHSMATESCLSLFNHPSLLSARGPGFFHSGLDFTKYSIAYWAAHVEYSYDRSMGERMRDLLKRFLGTPAKPGQGYCNFLKFLPRKSESGVFRYSPNHSYYSVSGPPSPSSAMSYSLDRKELTDLWEFDGVDINHDNRSDYLVSEPPSSSSAMPYFHFEELIMESWEFDGVDINHNNRSDYLVSEPPSSLFAMPYFHFGEELMKLWEFDGVDIDCNNDRDQSLLFLAVMRDNEGVIDILLEKGARINVGRDESTNPLMRAIVEGKAEIVIKLIRAGANVHPYHGRYADILQVAAHKGNSGVVEAVMAIDNNSKITDTVLVMAAKNEQFGQGVMRMLLSKYPNIEITEEVVVAAVSSGNKNWGPGVVRDRSSRAVPLMEMLLARDAGIEITEAIMIAAVNNRSSEVALIKMLLARDIEVTEAVMIVVASRPNPTLMELLLARCAKIEITEAVMIVAAGRFDSALMGLLLARDTNIKITEAVMIAAAENGSSLMEVLLARDPDIEITEAVMIAAADNWVSGVALMKMLLARDADIKITEAVMTAAVRRSNPALMGLLLARDANIKIAEVVMIAAAKNQVSGSSLMEVLLARDADIEITEAVMIAAAENRDSGSSLMEVLLAKDADIEITEAVMIAAAENQVSGSSLMEVLLTRDADIEITEAAMIAAANNWSSRVALMKMLLARDTDIEITEAVMIAAARGPDPALMEVLLARDANIEITEAVMIAAAENQVSGSSLMEVLLARDADIEITEAAMIAAANNWSSRVALMKMLLARDTDIEITEAVMIAAARGPDPALMEVLLARDANLETAEAVMIAAARESTPALMGLLLARDANIEITEAVMIAAAENQVSELPLMEVLLERDTNIETTEAVMIATANNQSSRVALMKMLLARDTDIEITEAVMIAAVNSGGSEVTLIKLLLARDPDIEITEEVLVVAAGKYNGEVVLEFVLSRYPDTGITEAVLVAAAESCGRNYVLGWLLSRYPDIEITEAVVVAAAAGHCDNGEVLKFLLSKYSSSEITEAVLIAAAGNKYSKRIIKLLLAREPSINITDTVMEAATRNSVHGKGITKLLLASNARHNSISIPKLPLIEVDDARL